MKKAWLYVAAISTMLISGCGLTDTPNELMRAPSADGDQQSINQAVMQFLPPGSQLTVPTHPDESSAVSLQDLDGDGSPEVTAFYKSEKTDYEIGVLILSQKQGNWAKVASFTGIGSELDYVMFTDITGDHIPEMMIGFGGGDDLNKELSVYSLAEGSLQELLKQTYSVMAVGDLNGDHVSELALVIHDHNNLTSKAQVYGATQKKLGKLTELELDGSVNGYEQAIIGKASANQNGLFIEAGLGAHSASTDLLVWDNGQLRNPLAKIDGQMDLTFKPYPLYSEDINDDGIIEIGVSTQPLGTDDLPMAAIPWISSYFHWDGATGLTHVEDHYQNYSYGIDFQIPQKWDGKYTIEIGQEPEIPPIHFLYFDETSKKKAELLTIQIVPQKSWSQFENDLKQKHVPYVLLKEEGKQVNVAIQPQGSPELNQSAMQEYKTMLLTPDEIRQLYRQMRLRF
ncbi:VCBS repeat-containing protein [Brevibacillus choshinensis]|uniref:VCBS repeat-containing protein n=1 Tax=Brevibacillus choshinensis TaxID=54911 RepID=A0ABX7FPB3_BRECH|nr:VCBS repeat-containing protein [Brevibacillus choshinensis]QRG68073.1 VCBS repeat-containing protein [Brevibacillus choshinensis]